jgi:hypothetical protein
MRQYQEALSLVSVESVRVVLVLREVYNGDSTLPIDQATYLHISCQIPQRTFLIFSRHHNPLNFNRIIHNTNSMSYYNPRGAGYWMYPVTRRLTTPAEVNQVMAEAITVA